jgi:hypothetical protein
LDEEEHSEEDLKECTKSPQLEFENSILQAFVDISYHEQGFDNEE